MAFTATGTVHGRERALTWTNGKLSGDPVAVAPVQGLVGAGESVSLAGLWSGAT